MALESKGIKVTLTMDSLPNEVLLKIIKMAATTTTGPIGRCPFAYHTGLCSHDNKHDDRHNFLIDVVSRISRRFRSLAEAPEFWRGAVHITMFDSSIFDIFTLRRTSKIPDSIRRPEKLELVKRLLGGETKELYIIGSGKESMDVEDLAERCPNLETLLLKGLWIDAWPTALPQPWTSLKNLHLYTPNSPFGEGIELHRSLPNLRIFDICSDRHPIQLVLPDMTLCPRLEKVWLAYGLFAFTSDPTDNLPKSLKNFHVLGDHDAWFFNLAEKRVFSYWEADGIMKLFDEYADDCNINWSDGYQDVPGGLALQGPQNAISEHGWKKRCLLALVVGMGFGYALSMLLPWFSFSSTSVRSFVCLLLGIATGWKLMGYILPLIR